MNRLILVSGLFGALLLGACDGNHGVYAPKGQIAAWSNGTGSTLVAVAYDHSNPVELGSSAIAADGSFAMPAIAAPAPELLADSLDHPVPATCTTAPKYDPASFKSTAIAFVVRDGAGVTRSVGPDDSRGYLQFLYSDRAVTASGKLVCPDAANINAQFDVHFVSGINALLYKETDPQTHESWVGTVELPSPLNLMY